MQKFIFLACLSAGLLLSGCHGGMVRKGLTQAEAGMAGVAGAPVSGRVSFAQVGDRVRVIAEVSGLQPGAYSLNLLDAGDCAVVETGASPTVSLETRGMAGALVDMPELVANSQGLGKLSAYLDEINLDSDQEAIQGRRIVIRAGVDGSRAHKIRNQGRIVACGVIKGR